MRTFKKINKRLVMIRTIFSLLVYFVFPCNFLSAQTELTPLYEPRHLSTSVIIPCAASHFRLIPELLNLYNEQTTPPDEVVVSLSECHRISDSELEATENVPWKFQLKIVKNGGTLSAGQNRNIAFAHSTGDLILPHDADDLPHPQRVEVVKHVFEHYEVDHLFHLWIPPEINFVPYDQDHLTAKYLTTYSTAEMFAIHNAYSCALRSVCEKVKWPEHFNRSEDTEFNQFVYKDPSIVHKAILFADFVKYRFNLSTSFIGS